MCVDSACNVVLMRKCRRRLLPANHERPYGKRHIKRSTKCALIISLSSQNNHNHTVSHWRRVCSIYVRVIPGVSMCICVWIVPGRGGGLRACRRRTRGSYLRGEPATHNLDLTILSTHIVPTTTAVTPSAPAPRASAGPTRVRLFRCV